jgi:hypothetical protein
VVPPSAEVVGVSVSGGGAGNSSVVRIKLSKPPLKVEQMSVLVRLLDLNGKLMQELKIPVNSTTSFVEVPVNKSIGTFNAEVATCSSMASSSSMMLVPQIIKAETIRVTSRSRVSRLMGSPIKGNFNFTPNSAVLSSEVRKELRQAAIAAKPTGARLAVTGLAAVSGLGSNFERFVAEQRAVAVAKFLRKKGIRTWILYRGLSGPESQAFEGNPRRVEIRILK